MVSSYISSRSYFFVFKSSNHYLYLSNVIRMENYLAKILSYLLNIWQSSFNQLFILFGPLLVLVLLLNLSAKLTTRLSVRFWGLNLFLYGFAWLGCSVHELSHAFFAMIFGHKITSIELFKPNSKEESLGRVVHSYNKKSIYQKTGNFLIGISPLLSGGIILYFSMLLIFNLNITKLSTFGISTQIFTDLAMFKQIGVDLLRSLKSMSELLFTGTTVVWWKSALILYILYSAGSSMTLSKSDVGSALQGFLWVIILFLIFNLCTLWIGNFAIDFLTTHINYISSFYFLLVLSFVANLLFTMILVVLNLVKSLFVGKH